MSVTDWTPVEDTSAWKPVEEKKAAPTGKMKRVMQQTMGGPPMFVDVPEEEADKFEQAGQKGYAQGGKIGMEMVGGAAGGEAGLGIKGLAGVVARMAGAGVGGAAGNVAGSLAGGNKPSATEAAETGIGFAAGQGLGEVAGKIPGLVKWLTSSKSLGAQMLNKAAAKAGTATVELSAKTNEAVEEMTAQAKLGGTMPKVISDLLERVGPTTKTAAEAEPGPLTYSEARILQSNMSELSASEKMALKPKEKRLLDEIRMYFSKDVQATADAAGVGQEHAVGMKQYAMASQRNVFAKKAAIATATGAVGYGAYSKSISALKDLVGAR